MKQPLFSIVIANYNYGRFLDDAVKSIFYQGMGADAEIIICDAKSTDNSVNIIKKYANGLPPNVNLSEWIKNNTNEVETSDNATKISWWCSEPDKGQSDAFNKGFSHVKGKFLTWLNADDMLCPGALRAIERLHRAYPKAEWLTGSSLYCDKDMRITDCFHVHRFSKIRARYGNLMVGGPSSFFTKRLLDAACGVDENLHYVMDLDLWMKFYRMGVSYRHTYSYIFAFRKHEASKMSGLDVSDNRSAVVNRNKAHIESQSFLSKYNKKNNLVRFLATALTFSPIDKILSKIQEIKWRGKTLEFGQSYKCRLKNAVVILGMSYPSGIMRYLSEFAVAVNRIDKKSQYDLYFASTAKENHIGAWDLIRNNFAPERILSDETFGGVIAKVADLLDKYDNVLFDFGGGWNQLKYVLPYKRRYRHRFKLVVTTHAFMNSSWKRVIMSILQGILYYCFVDKVVFQCPYTVRIFALSRLLLNSNRGCIIPLGVIPYKGITKGEVEVIPDVIREKGLVDDLCDKSHFNIVYLAEFRGGKNHVWLTEALVPIMKEEPSIHVYYCGGKTQGLTSKVEKLIEQHGLKGRFHIPGVIPRITVPGFLKRCNCAIVASASETFGHAYVEPMMVGVPVLGTRIGVGEYIIQDYFNGFGFSLKSAKEFRDRIRFLIDNPEQSKEMGLNGSRFVEQLFSMSNVARMRISLYRDILKI